MMRKLKDIVHHHPLMVVDDFDRNVNCSCCQKMVFIGSSVYCCGADDCYNVFMHTECAQLPEKLPKHPAHPIHPLIVQKRSSEYYSCSVCRDRDNWFLNFIYTCDDCNFSICVRCASRDQMIKHMSHPDMLIPINKIHDDEEDHYDAVCY